MTEDEISRIEKQADADDDVEDEVDIDEVVTLWATASVQRRELLNEVKRLRGQVESAEAEVRMVTGKAHAVQQDAMRVVSEIAQFVDHVRIYGDFNVEANVAHAFTSVADMIRSGAWKAGPK